MHALLRLLFHLALYCIKCMMGGGGGEKATSRVLLHKDKYREKSFMSVQYLFNLDNLTVLQYNAYSN